MQELGTTMWNREASVGARDSVRPQRGVQWPKHHDIALLYKYYTTFGRYILIRLRFVLAVEI